MDPYVMARRVNSANRNETLQQLLPLTHLFAGFPKNFIREIIEQYGDKTAIWWNANAGKNCELPSNEMVTFILQGKFLGIISREYDGDFSKEDSPANQGKDTTNRKLIIETLSKGKHFGDAMPPVGVYDEYDDKDFVSLRHHSVTSRISGIA